MNYPVILRRIRQRIFDYPENLEAKAMRVLSKVKARAIAQYAADDAQAVRGAFSGLTKRELALSRTCESDWN